MEKVRILLVDDDKDILELCVDILKAKGYEIVTAMGVKDALREFEFDSNFDLVITDYDMPDGTGADLATQILSGDQKNVGIILITGTINDVTEAEKTLFSKIFLKPFSISEFCGVIATLLN